MDDLKGKIDAWVNGVSIIRTDQPRVSLIRNKVGEKFSRLEKEENNFSFDFLQSFRDYGYSFDLKHSLRPDFDEFVIRLKVMSLIE